MKNLIKILCVFIIGTTLITGCSNSMKPKSNVGQKITIKWAAGLSGMPVEKDSPTEKYIEEKYNVDIEAISITNSYYEKLGTMFASNDIPDVMLMNEPSNWQPLAEQGIIAKVDKEFILKNAPNHYAAIENTEKKIWAITKYKNENWAVPKLMGKEYNTVALWHKEWLDKLGINKIPETIDEYEQAFTKIRNEDPDGNGIKDTYGLSGQGGHPVRQFDEFFAAFGVMPGQWRIVDGKPVMSTVTQEAKGVLELLNKWYNKGLIDPEMITDTTQTVSKKFDSNRLGYYHTALINAHPGHAVGRTNLDMLKKKNPSLELGIGPLPAGPSGQRGDWLWGPRSNFIVFGIQLEKDTAKMARILQILDDINYNEEVAMKVVWGEIGKTYDFIDSSVGPKGGLKYLPPYDNDVNIRAKEGIGQFGFFNLFTPAGEWSDTAIAQKYASDDIRIKNEAIANWGQGMDALIRPYLPSAQRYQSELDKLKTTAYSAFIMGQRPLSDWDGFVKEYMDKGGKQIQEEAQKFYDENIK